MANITTTYRDFFRAPNCEPACPRKDSPSVSRDDDDPGGCQLHPPQQQTSEEEEAECCPPVKEEEDPPPVEPCVCGGRARCPCVEALREAAAGNVMWPRRRPLTYYAKVIKEYPFMLKMYGEHRAAGVEVDPEDLLSVYTTDYGGGERRPLCPTRKGGAPPPPRVVLPFVYKSWPFRWDTAAEEQIPWRPSDCPLTADQLLLCPRRPRGCGSCGGYA